MTLLAIVTTARLLRARHRPPRCDTLRRVKKTSLYLDPDLDEALARRAADEGLTKAEFIRRTLAGGGAEAAPAQAARRRLPQHRRPERAARLGQDDGGLRRGLTVVLDTNVVVALYDAADPDHQARRRLDRDARRGPRGHAARAWPRWTTSSPSAAALHAREALWQRSRRRRLRSSAGGPTRSTRRSLIARRHPFAGLTDASLVALAGLLRTQPHRDRRPTLPIDDHARRGTLRAAPRRRLKGPDHARAPELVRRPRHAEGRRLASTRSSASTRCSPSTTWRGCPSASRCCSRTCCAPRATARSRRTTSRSSRAGTPRPSRARRSPSRPRAWSCRTSPACPPSSTWPPCATRWPTWAATRRRSTRSCPPSWSSTTRCRSTSSAPATPSASTPSASSSATRSATRSCAGARTPSTTSPSCRPTPGSCTRSTSSTSRAWSSSTTRPAMAYPDTLVGTDSHTTMINGLGVLGWGVGGIEAEAAMLGQPMSMLIPQVLGFKLHGELPEGATATDLVLTVTELLRKKGVVGKFVEFYGPGVSRLPLADRATIGNMSPEFGSTCAIFPIDAETLRYLAFSGRPKELIDLVEAYAKEQGLWHDEHAEEPTYSDTVELDLGDVVPSLAGPKRPQDRVPLHGAKDAFRGGAGRPRRPGRRGGDRPRPRRGDRRDLPGLRPAGQRRARPRARPARAGLGARGGGGDRDRRALRHRGRGHAGRRDVQARPRARRHRRHHVVHEHLQPVGHARRRPAGAQRRGARADQPAVGQDVAGAGVQGGHRVPGPRRADRAARAARLQPRRLRLHDVHRQLRPAARRDQRRGQRGATSRSARCSAATATSRGASTPT